MTVAPRLALGRGCCHQEARLEARSSAPIPTSCALGHPAKRTRLVEPVPSPLTACPAWLLRAARSQPPETGLAWYQLHCYLGCAGCCRPHRAVWGPCGPDKPDGQCLTGHLEPQEHWGRPSPPFPLPTAAFPGPGAQTPALAHPHAAGLPAPSFPPASTDFLSPPGLDSQTQEPQWGPETEEGMGIAQLQRVCPRPENHRAHGPTVAFAVTAIRLTCKG